MRQDEVREDFQIDDMLSLRFNQVDFSILKDTENEIVSRWLGLMYALKRVEYNTKSEIVTRIP